MKYEEAQGRWKPQILACLASLITDASAQLRHITQLAAVAMDSSGDKDSVLLMLLHVVKKIILGLGE